MNNFKKSSYQGYLDALASLLDEDENVVVLECKNPSPNTKSANVSRLDFPSSVRRIAIPEAEQDMVLSASGLALGSFTVYIDTPDSTLLIARSYEQIRSAVAVPNLKVVLSSVHDGDSFHRDGAVRQMFEDFALMRSVPNMAVLAPADYNSAYALTRSLVTRNGPSYMRLSCDEDVDVDIYEKNEEFYPGGAKLITEGNGVTICANGMMLREAIAASKILSQQGIEAEIIDCYSIKPFPERVLLASVRRTGCCVVAEKHASSGGLYGEISECLGRNYTVPVRGVAMASGFGQSGLAQELKEYYGLTYREIVHNVVQVWAMRRR